MPIAYSPLCVAKTNRMTTIRWTVDAILKHLAEAELQSPRGARCTAKYDSAPLGS